MSKHMNKKDSITIYLWIFRFENWALENNSEEQLFLTSYLYMHHLEHQMNMYMPMEWHKSKQLLSIYCRTFWFFSFVYFDLVKCKQTKNVLARTKNIQSFKFNKNMLTFKRVQPLYLLILTLFGFDSAYFNWNCLITVEIEREHKFRWKKKQISLFYSIDVILSKFS